MEKWNIYHKDGSFLTDANGNEIIVHDLEYSDSWMGECYLTISFKNEAPINFAIGDYVVYRGEKFELNYDPGKNKQARKNTYGEGFVYDSVKFNALQDELVRTEFLDVVLSDNQLHYTALPKFSFYVETLDDLLDRIQANINEQIGEDTWHIYSRSLERSKQRGCTEDGWNEVYGKGTSGPSEIDSKSISIDTKNCWEALALVNSEWDINFIVRGRDICVETIGVPTKNVFKYGLGNGLYEVDQNAESDQSVVTRLRAYGSENNLPSFYYADLGTKYKANASYIVPNVPELRIGLDLAYVATYFKVPRQISTTENTDTGYVVEVTFDFITYVNCAVLGAKSGECVLFVVNGADKSLGYEPSLENINKFKAQLLDGQTKLYFSSGINTKTIPNNNKEYAENLPNNMACNRLMLPGFPHLSLKEYWDTLTDEEKKYVNPSGKEHVFSEDKYRPYIDSVNISKIGLRSASKFFDQDDKTNGIIDIYPTIEEMEVDGHRVDAIYKGSNIEDNGRFEDNQTVDNFDIYLDPALDFNINDLRENDFAVNMKDGMCGGRTFSVAAASKTGASWKLTLKRTKDDALELWFPYKDYQINVGDHFVLTGITMPDQYVRAASLKLLKYAIAFLDKNDYTRYVYQPKVDEIFMARQHDEAIADTTGAITSLHDTLKAGDLMQFEEEDFGIKATITIDKLTIKEANGSIPTYDITLREDKEVGTIKKIQNQINSLMSGNGANTTATMNQLRNLIPQEGAKYFASKIYKDEVQDTLTFDKFQVFLAGLESQGIIGAYNGVDFDNDGTHYLDGTGSGVLGDVIVDRLHDKNSTPSDRVIVGAQGFDLYMGNDGKSHLYVDYLTTRTKMFASSLEIRKVSYSGGTTIFSNAGSEICKVSYIWSEDKASVIAYKCYSVADDGTTKTMNWWHVGMMALCQTFNVKAGETSNAANRYYWRMVVGVGQEKLEDGKLYDYVILSNQRVFQGNAAVIPSFTQGVIGDDKPLVFGNVMVQVVNQNSMMTMAQLFQEQEDKTTDDGGTQIASRLFYGYESVDGGEEQEPDAPQPLDVIVQVGDQIQWKKYGNLIKLSTSVEDNATENAPAITMYHNLGAPYTTGKKDDDGNDMISPFQWKTITTIISPEKVMHNADNFILFQGTPDNIVDPIVISYDIIPTTNYMTRHPQTLSTTPANIGFRLRKRSGNKTEWIDDAKIYADYTDIDNVEHKNVLLSTNNLSDLGNAYNILSATIHTTIKVKDQEDELVTFDLPVLTDGVKGDDGTNGKDGVNGKDGAKGEKGDKGDKGDDGVGIKTADVIYCVSDSETTQPSDTADWKTLFSELTLLPNKYVWSCTKVTLTNGISTYSGKQCLGKCEDFISITEQYALGDSQTQAPTSGWGTSYTPTKEKWLWSRSEMAWSNGSKTYTTPICTGYFSKDGTNGKNGNYTEYFFAISASKTTSSSSVAPSDIQAWQTTAQIPTEAKPYVWMQVRKVENDKVVSTSYVRVNGEDGENGKDGKDGKNGVDGTDGAYTSYDYNIAKQNVSYSTATFYYSKWQDAPMEVTKDYPFLWMRMTRKNDPNDKSITYVCLTGAKGEQGIQGLQGLQGDKGEQGIPGKDGTNGSTTYFHIKYSSYENPTSASQMTETPSTYIGTYVDFTQADSTDPKKYTWARFQGIQGDKGDKGIPGTNGIDGKTSYLHIKYSNDGGKTFTSNSGEDVGEYIGTCVDNNVNDPTSVSSYTWAKIKGTDGTDGVGIASVEEHYQVSSSNTTAPTTWQSSVPAMTETNKYLWNYETIHYTNGTTADSNKRVIGVYGDSGVGIKSVVNYYLATSASSGVTTSTSGWTTTIQAISSTNKYLWNYEVLEYTNGKNTTTTPCIIGTYGRDGKDGTNGTNGTNGEDAINIYVEGAPLVFDTADDGVVVASDAKSAKIYIFQKGVNQTSKALNVSLLKDKCVNLNTADVSKTSNYIEVTIKGGAIQKDALTVDGTTDYVSKATGYAVVQFSFGSVMYQRQIVFNVNVARYTHTMKQTSKELESKYTEVSKSLDDVSSDLLDVTDMANRTDEDYRKFESTFEQNAREIAMSVTSETVGRRNLLLGSDFRQQDGFWLNNAGIEINSGYKGINCVHAISSGSSVYAGVYWHANNSYPSLKNIPIVVGKKYTLSCWVKCSSTTAKIRLNATYAKTASQTDFSGMKSENNQVQVDAANEWQLVNVTFSPTDSSYPYAAIAIFTTGANLYVCMPMLEEGEVVNPWTLHKEDYNFVGGNMLDNTRWLTEDQNNNPSFAPAAKYLDYDSGRQAVFTNTVGANQRALKVLTTDMKTGQDYILSFLCKCDVSYMVTAGFSNSAYDVFAEDWQGGTYRKQTTSSTSTTLIVSTMRNVRSDTYEHVWVHLRFNGKLPTSVQVLTKSGTIYIAQPKLEECCCLTEWTERKSDFVDENRLRKTGISITDGTITLNADNTIISGDLHLRGVLVENTEEVTPTKVDDYYATPIVCDLVSHKSVAVQTDCDYASGACQRQVLLPMIYDVEVDRYKTGTQTVKALKESGVKLTIMSKYNPYMAKWKNAPRHLMQDSVKINSQRYSFQGIVSQYLTVVFADPRLARYSNYENGVTAISPSGMISTYDKYKDGCFVCNGRRGRVLLLMPGQSVNLTSSVEVLNGKEVLVWYVDNSSEFTAIHRKVQFGTEEDDSGNSYTITSFDTTDWESFPDELVEAHYEDALFAPPELDCDYPQDSNGNTKTSQIVLNINTD